MNKIFLNSWEKREEEELKYQREIEREKERQRQLNQKANAPQNRPGLKVADFEDYEPDDSFANQGEEEEYYDNNADSEEDED